MSYLAQYYVHDEVKLLNYTQQTVALGAGPIDGLQ